MANTIHPFKNTIHLTLQECHSSCPEVICLSELLFSLCPFWLALQEVHALFIGLLGADSNFSFRMSNSHLFKITQLFKINVLTYSSLNHHELSQWGYAITSSWPIWWAKASGYLIQYRYPLGQMLMPHSESQELWQLLVGGVEKDQWWIESGKMCQRHAQPMVSKSNTLSLDTLLQSIRSL